MNLSSNGRLLSDFLDSKMTSQAFTNEDLVHFIEQIGGYLNIQSIPDYAKTHKMSYNGVKKFRTIKTIFNTKYVIDND